MIIIGLVLLLGAVVFGLDLMWKNSYTIHSPALFGQTLGIHNAAAFFLVGAHHRHRAPARDRPDARRRAP